MSLKKFTREMTPKYRVAKKGSTGVNGVVSYHSTKAEATKAAKKGTHDVHRRLIDKNGHVGWEKLK